MKKQNNTTATATATNATLAGMQYVLAHKSELVGTDLEKLATDLARGYLRAERERTQFNGRMATLLSCNKTNKLVYSLLSSAEFRASMRSRLTHVTLVETDGNGNVVKSHVVLCKYKIRNEHTVVLDVPTCKKFMPSIKAADNRLALASYLYDEGETACSDFAALALMRKHEVAVEREVEIDGKPTTVRMYTTDAEGKRTLVTRLVEDEFYPVLNESVSPKDFADALKSTLADMWVYLFPQKSESESAK